MQSPGDPSLIGGLLERYLESHGCLCLPLLLAIYSSVTLSFALLAYLSRGETGRKNRRIFGILLLAWIVAIPCCVILEDEQYRRSLQPQNLFKSAFDFPLPPDVTIVSVRHADSFDSTYTYFHLLASKPWIDRIAADPSLHWDPGLDDVRWPFHGWGLDDVRTACPNATRTFHSSQRRAGGFSSRWAFLCIDDANGTVDFFDSSLD